MQKDIAREIFNLKDSNDKNEGIKLIKKLTPRIILHAYVIEELYTRRGSKTSGLNDINLMGRSTPKEKIKLVKQLKFLKSIEP